MSELDQVNQIHPQTAGIVAFAEGVQNIRWARQLISVELLSDEANMPAIEKDKSFIVKFVTVSQKVVQGRLTALAWRNSSAESMTKKAKFIAGR